MDDKPGPSNIGKSTFYPEFGFEDNFNPKIQETSKTNALQCKTSSHSNEHSSPSKERFSHVQPSPMVSYVLRLKHGEELRKSLLAFVKEKQLKAAFIITAVGSAKTSKIRLANAAPNMESHYILDLQQPQEIVSLEGTIGGGGHMHVALSDVAGKMTGGHLVELIVDTTVEVVIGECTALSFSREFDMHTQFNELVVHKRK